MSERKEVHVPDIGDFDEVEVIEILVKAGDEVAVEDPILTLESDKATMDIPAPYAGRVAEVTVDIGAMVGEGALIAVLESADADSPDEQADADEPGEQADADEPSEDGPAEAAAEEAPDDTDSATAATGEAPASSESKPEPKSDSDSEPEPEPEPAESRSSEEADAAAPGRQPRGGAGPLPHASPSVRKFARELGVDLATVSGSGRKGRILHDDVKGWVKRTITTGAGPGSGSFVMPPQPEVDYSKHGPVETVELSKIRRATAQNMARSWLTIPHVTQFEDADVTELERFRKAHNAELDESGTRLTMLAFLVKAVVDGLKTYPDFNSSLRADGQALIRKDYFHIGIAVNTPLGLTVPVLRDADTKGVAAIAAEIKDLSGRARDRKLAPKDMQGGTFTISNLGAAGGTAFTPIVNLPEVAILGLSPAAMKPVYQDGAFVPRLILPLSLSYDHRVIDGVAAALFARRLSFVLGDIRNLLL